MQISHLIPKLAASLIAVGIAVLASRALVARETIRPWQGDPSPPPGLDAAVSRVFASSECVTATRAESQLAVALPNAGEDGWDMVRGPGVADGSCVAATVDTVHLRVVLIMGMNPRVRAAITKVADELLERCLAKDDAVRLLNAAVTSAGETGSLVRTDGPIGGPIGSLDRVRTHVDQGCWVYSSTGWTKDGTRVYYLAGH